jgi:hypothetical protein
MRISSTLFLFSALVALSRLAPAEDAKDVQQNLESKYKLTVINAEGGVVIQGVKLVLKKRDLVASANSCTNDYKDGKLSLAKGPCTGSSVLKKVCPPFVPNCPGRLDPNGLAQATRPFVTGENLYVTKIEVKDSVNFSLVSDAIKDVVYKAEVRFQFPKGSPPDSAKAAQLTSELFTISQDNSQGVGGAAGGQASGGQAPAGASGATPPPAPEPQPAALPPIAPPPPPPDAPAAPTPTVSLGMAIDQVVGIMGQPTARVDLGNKQIYTYPSLKISFVDGKVSDVQ